MNAVFLFAVLAMMVMALPYCRRIVVGPTIFDRVVGLNGLGTNVPVLLVYFGLLYEDAEMVVDIALSLFLLNLVTTLLVAKLVRDRGEVYS